MFESLSAGAKGDLNLVLSWTLLLLLVECLNCWRLLCEFTSVEATLSYSVGLDVVFVVVVVVVVWLAVQVESFNGRSKLSVRRQTEAREVFDQTDRQKGSLNMSSTLRVRLTNASACLLLRLFCANFCGPKQLTEC